jgi:hypothetical protein
MEDLRFMNTTKTINLLFYKGPGNFRDQLVRLWTQSPYSHSEFGRSDGFYHSNDRFSLLSRLESFEISPNDWEICQIILPAQIVDRLERRQIKKNGTKYDWIGIVFSQVFRLGLHDSKRWFCSKSNADDLRYAYKLMKRSRKSCFEPYVAAIQPIQKFKPNELSPFDLFTIVREIEHIQTHHTQRIAHVY